MQSLPGPKGFRKRWLPLGHVGEEPDDPSLELFNVPVSNADNEIDGTGDALSDLDPSFDLVGDDPVDLVTDSDFQACSTSSDYDRSSAKLS